MALTRGARGMPAHDVTAQRYRVVEAPATSDLRAVEASGYASATTARGGAEVGALHSGSKAASTNLSFCSRSVNWAGSSCFRFA